MERLREGCPFEIVGVFSSNPDAKAVATAEERSVPCVSADIREYYAKREKPINDMSVRAEYDKEAVELLERFNADMVLLAGYVWATTDAVLDRYTVINVHPADLMVTEDGKRKYAGADGVGAALKAGEPYIAATSHIATKEVDCGPLLIISERVPVDYGLHDDTEKRMRHYLGLVNEQARLTGARTILEVALGNFTADPAGGIFYKGKPAPAGIRIESWDENIPLHERHIGAFSDPVSVAVIGASPKPGIGRAIAENIINGGYKGALYAVNKRAEDVLSAKGYGSVSEIPGGVDLAVFAIPSDGVLGVAEECGKKGVKAIVCITAGFKEIGAEGAAAEDELLSIVNKYNMRLIGPNCMGISFSQSKLYANILSSNPKEGGVALVTQSGAIGAAVADNDISLDIGFSSIVSLGNQSDVNVCDILEILADDEKTKSIVLYMEAFSEPYRFLKIISGMNKPVFIIKSGSTQAGAAAASSHTGSLAGNDSIAEAMIERSGAVRIKSLHDAFLTASAAALMPALKGDRVCVLTNAGGPGILIADDLCENGFLLPELPKEYQDMLAPKLFREASVKNPIDVVATARPEHYAEAIRLIKESGLYDALLICCVTPASVDTKALAAACAEEVRDLMIPVLTCFMGDHMGEASREIMHKNDIPVFEYPEKLVTVLKNLRLKEVKEIAVSGTAVPAEKQARAILDKARPGEYLSNADAYALLDCFGILYAKNLVLKSTCGIDEIDGIDGICRTDRTDGFDLEFPVVAKIEHPEIIHKSDVGGVALNIMNKQELVDIYNAFMKKFEGATGVFVQEQSPDGLEMILGCANDGVLGSAVMAGMGGTLVEVMNDVRFVYPPFGVKEAEGSILKLRCAKLLEGYRGKEGANISALAEMMVSLGDMLCALPDIVEIDLNPLIYDKDKDRFVAVDVRVRRGQ